MIPTPNCLQANRELAHLMDGIIPSFPFVQATLYYLNATSSEYVAWMCVTSTAHVPTLPNLEAFHVVGVQMHEGLPIFTPYAVACSLSLTDDSTWLWVCFDVNATAYTHLSNGDRGALQMLRLPLLDLIERYLRDELMQRALQATRHLMTEENSEAVFEILYRTFLSPQQHDAILLTQCDLTPKDAQYLAIGASYFVEQGHRWKLGKQVEIGLSSDYDDLISQIFEGAPPSNIEWHGFTIKNQVHVTAILLVGWHQTRLQDRLEQAVFLQEIQTSFETWCKQFYRRVVSSWVNIQDVADGIQDGLLLVKVREDHAKVVLENLAFRNLFGLSEQHSVVGLWLYELLIRIPMETEMRNQLRKIWNEVVVLPQFRTMHIRITDLHGIERVIHWFCVPIPTNLDISQSMLVFTFRDVSATEATKEARLNFFSRISHELRTPLTSIRGFTEMLLQHTDETFSIETQEYLRIISQSSQHLENLLSDILEIIRLDAGDTSFKLQSVTFAGVLKEAIQQSRELYNQGERTIFLKDHTRSAYIMADRNRLVRALTNLIGNAMVYSPPDSPIHLTVKRCDTLDNLPSHVPNGMIVPCLLLEIRDSGNGLSIQDVERVFEPFYRSKWVIRQRIPGVGLGLAVARSFIEKQNGKSWATVNQPDSPGGKFYVTLPLIEKPKKKS